jgi:hypothetical protein
MLSNMAILQVLEMLQSRTTLYIQLYNVVLIDSLHDTIDDLQIESL